MRRVLRGGLGLGLALVVLTGCSTPPALAPDELLGMRQAIAELVSGLRLGDVGPVPLDISSEVAQADFVAATGGMGSFLPIVESGAPKLTTTDGSARAALVPLHFSWQLLSGTWSYDSAAQVVRRGGQWVVHWESKIVHPQLSASSRIVFEHTEPQRGAVLGAKGVALTPIKKLVRIGIDKGGLSESAQQESALRLADAMNRSTMYAEQVAVAGGTDFVVLGDFNPADVPAAARKVPGFRAVNVVEPTQPGAARQVVGLVVTADVNTWRRTGGLVQPGDRIGLDGLELRYDTPLRGKAGIRVRLVARPALPSPSPKPTTKPTTSVKPVLLYQVAPVAGQPLRLTLDAKRSADLAAALSGQAAVTSAVALNPATGAIEAVGETVESTDIALEGFTVPGEPFQLVTALALMRSGVPLSTSVNCVRSIKVGARTFTTRPGYPANKLGKMTITQAVANGCGTALIPLANKLSGTAIRDAGASLGIGAAAEAGFAVERGQIPVPDGPEGLAQLMLGQGEVEVSPVAMAGAVASVVAGKTVLAYLLVNRVPKSVAAPLTPGEVAGLRGILTAGVSQGGAAPYKADASQGLAGLTSFNSESGGTVAQGWAILRTKDQIVCLFSSNGADGGGKVLPAYLRPKPSPRA